MEETFVIAHGVVCTLGSEEVRIIEDGAVLVVGDEIRAVGHISDVMSQSPPGVILVDAGGKLILPGFVCAHSHFYGLFSRGMNLHDDPPSNFIEVLERLWWRLDRALDLESVGLSAEALVARGLRCGTTCYVDHHASPNAIAGSLDAIATATTRLGARAALCYEVTDRNGEAGAQAGIDENVRFMRRCATDNNPLLGANFGLHASFTISDATLTRCVDAVRALRAEGLVKRGLGFHVHAAEGELDEDDSLRQHGCRAIARLERAGVLGEDTIVGHGVHADAQELAALRRTHTALVVNPESNMNNAVGLPSARAHLSDAGPELVGLGTDGMTYDMLQEFRALALALRHEARDQRAFCAADAQRVLFRGNSLVASRLFAKPVGRLEPGCFADVVLADYESPTRVTPGNVAWHLQFGLASGDVRDVYVGGRLVVSKGKLLTADEAEIAARARAATPRVWEAFRVIAEQEKAARAAPK